MLELLRQLTRYTTGVVAPDNAAFFDRLAVELPFTQHQYASGSEFQGWVVPQLWRVHRATLSRSGQEVFDGTAHPLGVATYSRSFNGELDLDDLRPHLVTNPRLPDALVYHCMWQYRPWDATWALSVPYRTYQTLSPGRYRVNLETSYEPGKMLVADYEHRGESGATIVFNAHTCHPGQANDDMAGVVVLVRLFQWLRGRRTHYTYRLVLGPEHLGTVFYLSERPRTDLESLVGGIFAEMPGTSGPIKVASSFLGDQAIDRVVRHAARHYAREHVFVPWRQGAGNDETVWEAPGYEVPFVEVSRSLDLLAPYPEYHSSLDTPDLMDESRLQEFLTVLQRVVDIFEGDARLYRCFDGLVCLSNPAYNLYFERPDPALDKSLPADSEKWGYLVDCLLRYLDGSMTVLDIAERHDLPFDRVHAYLKRFEEKRLVRFAVAPIARAPISARAGPS